MACHAIILSFFIVIILNIQKNIWNYLLGPLEKIKTIIEKNLDLSLDKKVQNEDIPELLKRMIEEISHSYLYNQRIIDSLEEYLIVVDEEFSIRRSNNKFHEIYDDIIGKKITNFLYNLNGEKNISQSRILNGGDQNFLLKKKNGEFLSVILNISEMLGDFNNFYIITLKDANNSMMLKELKNNQLQLVESAKLASLGELSSGVAHELNNPLMFVQGFTNRIEKEIKKRNPETYKDIEEYFQDVNFGIKRIRDIVDYFRDFSRTGTKEKTRLIVQECIRRSFILFNDQLKTLNVKVHMEMPEDSIILLGDQNRLEQVFMNFIANSRDALKDVKEEKRLSVSVSKINQNCQIVFQDNGSGISDENIQKLFDPFFTTKPVGKGTGLGLSISYGIIKEHDGEIQIDNSSDTKFIINIPIYTE